MLMAVLIEATRQYSAAGRAKAEALSAPAEAASAAPSGA